MTDNSNQSASAGWISPWDTSHPENIHHFRGRQLQARLRTNVLVKVIAVHAGSYPHSYTVDVQPLVNQVDIAGTSQPHGTVYGIPMLSGSGGNGAVVVKPKAGDMGFMAIGDRDQSAAIAANGQANPGSRRMHSMSDGIYLGGFANQNNASAYIVIDENGLTIKGDLNVTGKITASGEVKGNNIKLSTHTHSGVTTGSDHSGAPDSGT
jgi:hypothetical protein